MMTELLSEGKGNLQYFPVAEFGFRCRTSLYEIQSKNLNKCIINLFTIYFRANILLDRKLNLGFKGIL